MAVENTQAVHRLQRRRLNGLGGCDERVDVRLNSCGDGDAVTAHVPGPVRRHGNSAHEAAKADVSVQHQKRLLQVGVLQHLNQVAQMKASVRPETVSAI